jgi:hypothetical protein
VLSTDRRKRRPDGGVPGAVSAVGQAFRPVVSTEGCQIRAIRLHCGRLPVWASREQSELDTVRSLVERLLLGGVGEDHVEARISDELVHQ